MIDKFAPIIPFIGMGGIRLNSTKAEVEQVLGERLPEGEVLHNGQYSQYILGNEMSLCFSEVTGRLTEMETLPGYKGKLFGKIGTDTDEKDLIRLEPSLEYNNFEEVFVSKEKGRVIETDLPSHKAVWISISAKDH